MMKPEKRCTDKLNVVHEGRFSMQTEFHKTKSFFLRKKKQILM